MTPSSASTSGSTESLWVHQTQPLTFARLSRNLAVDVCVIGAGLAGITVAYLLRQNGLSVAVLEDGFIGSGETGRTTAHLSNAFDDRYTELERIHGRSAARLAAESHTAAIDWIDATVQKDAIACDFRRLDGYLILAPDQERDLLIHERDAAHRAGLRGVELLNEAPTMGVRRPCLKFPRQGQFHPLRYLQGLAQAFVRNGGHVFTQTHVEDILSEPSLRVTAAGYVIEARDVVVATNTPINDRVAIHTKQAPYRTYVVGLTVPRGALTPALYWDTLDPYHYVRLQPYNDTHDMLIVGGEDHKTGQGEDRDRYGALAEWARAWFPLPVTRAFEWSGQVMEPVDGVAFIGKNPGDEHVYIVTGDSGMGMTHGTIGGLLITDLICGRENRWTGLYDPGRKPVRAIRDYLGENVNVAAQYTDWLPRSDVDSLDEIHPGQGAIVTEGLTKLAVYRDPQGLVHKRSAVCPHLRCIVRWNPGERTWDCPCHGSRFDCFGKVMNGPANSDLPEAA